MVDNPNDQIKMPINLDDSDLDEGVFISGPSGDSDSNNDLFSSSPLLDPAMAMPYPPFDGSSTPNEDNHGNHFSQPQKRKFDVPGLDDLTDLEIRRLHVALNAVLFPQPPFAHHMFHSISDDIKKKGRSKSIPPEFRDYPPDPNSVEAQQAAMFSPDHNPFMVGGGDTYYPPGQGCPPGMEYLQMQLAMAARFQAQLPFLYGAARPPPSQFSTECYVNSQEDPPVFSGAALGELQGSRPRPRTRPLRGRPIAVSTRESTRSPSLDGDIPYFIPRYARSSPERAPGMSSNGTSSQFGSVATPGNGTSCQNNSHGHSIPQGEGDRKGSKKKKDPIPEIPIHEEKGPSGSADRAQEDEMVYTCLGVPLDDDDEVEKEEKPFIPPPLIDSETGLMGEELDLKRRQDYRQEVAIRKSSLRNEKWKEGDEQSVKDLFRRLKVNDPEHEPIVRTYLWGRNQGNVVKWVQAFLNRNRGHVYIPHKFTVLNVWNLDRPGDKLWRSEVYNKHILFHGVNKDNVYAYLKEGFGAKEAWSSNKAVFQNAIYFHDCSTKAANFTFPDAYRWERKADRQLCKPMNNEIIYILICHVALGAQINSEQPIKSKSMLKSMWDNYDSLRLEGLCRCTGVMKIEGGSVEIPMGPFTQLPAQDELDHAVKTHSLFDDYCIQNHHLARISYLAEVQYIEERVQFQL